MTYQKHVMSIVAIMSAISDTPEKPRYKAQREGLGIALNMAIVDTLEKFDVTREQLFADVVNYSEQ